MVGLISRINYDWGTVLAAVNALREAVVLDQEGGNFRAAARHYQDIAELCESSELDRPKEAYEAYGKAAELYNADDSPA